MICCNEQPFERKRVIGMYRKNCEKCSRPSFSSCEIGEWFCPICGNDLTQHPFFDAMTLEQLSIKRKYTYQKRTIKNGHFPIVNDFSTIIEKNI